MSHKCDGIVTCPVFLLLGLSRPWFIVSPTSPTATKPAPVGKPASPTSLTPPIVPLTFSSTYYTQTLSFPLHISAIAPTVAWVSSLGPSIVSARLLRWLYALYWVPIRVSSHHAIVGTWISLAPSFSNLVSRYSPSASAAGAPRYRPQPIILFFLTCSFSYLPLGSDMFCPLRRNFDDGNNDLSHSK
jgi:hypothetical protein